MDWTNASISVELVEVYKRSSLWSLIYILLVDETSKITFCPLFRFGSVMKSRKAAHQEHFGHWLLFIVIKKSFQVASTVYYNRIFPIFFALSNRTGSMWFAEVILRTGRKKGSGYCFCSGYWGLRFNMCCLCFYIGCFLSDSVM